MRDEEEHKRNGKLKQMDGCHGAHNRSMSRLFLQVIVAIVAIVAHRASSLV